MNKTLTINLGGFIFHIDEEAYHKLELYLAQLKQQFEGEEGGDEIVQDIESRIAELFKERLDGKEVVSMHDVESVVKIMGQPEDYLNEGEESSQRPQEPKNVFYGNTRTIFRDVDARIIGGVASGLGHYFKIDAIWMRLIFVALFFAGFGTVVYIILWIVVPKAQTTAEKLQMRGERVNISTIEKSIRDEMDAVGGKIRDFSNKAQSHDYSRYRKSAGGFFNDFGRFIGTVARGLVRIIGKLFGFLLVLMAFGILIATMVGITTNGFQLMGSNVGLSGILEFLQLVTLSDLHYSILLIGLGLVTVAPLFLIVYLGLRLLFNLEPLNSSARNGLLLSIFIGFIFLIFGGIRFGVGLDEDATLSKRETLQLPNDSMRIEILADEYYRDFEKNNFSNVWIQKDGINLFTSVQLRIFKSPDSLSHVVIETSANAGSRREAQAFAQNVNPKFEVNERSLYFANYIALAPKERYCGQSATFMLYIPVGQKIYLEHNTIDLIYDIDNVQNMWDHKMTGHWWVMTERGLSCMDCLHERNEYWPEDNNEIDDADELPEQEEEPTDSAALPGKLAMVILPEVSWVI